MPIVRNITAGAQVVASAKIARHFTLNVGVGSSTTFTDAQLQVNTLPNCFWYAFMTDAVGGVTLTPQFAVDNTPAVGGGIQPRYFNVLPPQVLIPNVPFFTTQRLIANMISGIITVPGGAAGPVTVQLILASSM
jgi:hypothetical protein